MSESTEYTVTWTMQIGAASPRAAAEQAREYQRDPLAEVGCFEVVDPAGASADVHRIDLDSEICSDPYDEGCYASHDDGEGYDGACGSCADRQYAEDEDDDDSGDD